ncbi:MAG: UDP-N-acetylmuramoyl-L-alanyl-D-glutamate--2,6-diaminopimelate ligase [Eubacteriales bacterium]|nr:UDP-N-acetylmuramoyl-L-alanyl-D-glutamate--2,6-diaminopimelate ligase [Eubacteriales bacterium]
MKIENLIKNLEYIKFKGNKETEITGLTIDSRKVLEGNMYVAIKGFNVDGHKYINSAIEKGAKLILCEDEIELKNEDISILQVENSRKALSLIAKNFYNNPTEKLNIIGFTGTNGKTSSTYFMEQILKEYNKSTGVIGTIEIRANGEKLDFDFATSTTPDTIELNQLFNKFIEKGIENIAMEVSSHALELEKVSDCKIKIGVFTNLTQDHLDLHKDMENYCKAKAKLFKMCEIGILNADDKYCDKMLEGANCKVLKYSIEKPSDLQAKNIQYLMDKVEFDININEKDEHFILNIPGRFSVYNALGVIGASIMLGIPINTIKNGIAKIKGVKGRIQTIPNNKGFNVIVDYAHSPDGLDNIIKAVREFTKGRIITVFGCGGDRDRKKRPIMGEISAKLSDYTIITSDNPRSEVPESIIDEIETGVSPITKEYEKITSRKEAIFKAIKIAKPNDSVIIAGKGHEDYEIFADKIIHFNDTEVANEALEDLK